MINHPYTQKRIQLVVFSNQTLRLENHESDCNKDSLKTVNKNLLSPRPYRREITKKQKVLTMTLSQVFGAVHRTT